LHYPVVWSWEAFADLDYDSSDCPVAEKACSQVLSLPVFAQSSDEDLACVASAIKRSIAELE